MIHSGNRPKIHVSGHAHQEEQKLMLQLVRPRLFIPVHGHYQHLALHARLAQELGVSGTLLIENGEVAEVTRDAVVRAGKVRAGRVHRDGPHDVDTDVLRERRALADSGLTAAFIVLDRDLNLLADPNVTCRGILPDDALVDALAGASRRLRDEIESAPEAIRNDIAALREHCRRALRRYFEETVGRRPLALIGVTVVDGPSACPAVARRDARSG